MWPSPKKSSIQAAGPGPKLNPSNHHHGAPMTTSAIHELFPYLCVSDAGKAIEFYKQAFGVTERFRLTEPSGRIGHAELQFGPMVLMLSDPFPEYGVTGAPPEGVPSLCLHIHVDNADELGRRAVAAGATMISEPSDAFYGERS